MSTASTTYLDLSPADRSDMAVIAARIGGTTVGLAVADREGGRFVVRSFFVDPSHSGRGVGKGLASALEQAVRRLGGTRIEAMIQATGPTAPAAARLAESAGWRPSQPSTLVCRASGRMRQAPWMDRPLPAGFELFSWRDLSDEDREQLKSVKAPAALTPFPEEPVEPLNSVGLRRGGRVVGWMLTHRLGPDLIRYTSLFVEPEHRTLGTGMVLLSEAIRRQLDAGVPFGIFGVGEANEPMIRLVKRRMAPYLDEFQEIRYVAKDL